MQAESPAPTQVHPVREKYPYVKPDPVPLVQKPYSFADLYQAISQVLDKQEEEPYEE
jgi:hypothetical protein